MNANLEVERGGRLLRALAWLQAPVLVGLIVALLLRGNTLTPSPAAAAATSPTVNAATASGTQSKAMSTLAPESSVPSSYPTSPASPPAAAGTVLYGRVVDEAGEPITEGVVWFYRSGESQPFATVSLQPRDSGFAFAGLSPGTVEYRTRVSGYNEQHETIDVPAGLPRLRRDIVLTRAWLLAVKIQTPAGEPLHLALQAASKARPLLHHVEVAAVATATEPSGDFEPTPLREIDFGLGRWRSATGFSPLDRGGPRQPKDVAGVLELPVRQPVWVSAVMRHHVLASTQVQPDATEVVLTVGFEQVTKDLGSIRGRVVDAVTGAPVPEARVGFSDLQSGGSGDKVDPQGLFEVNDLRPGLLDVEIRAGRRAARRDLVLLQPGETLDLGDVPVFEYRSIKGRCEGLRGKAENCRIAWTPLDPPWHPAVRRLSDSTSIAADGSFTWYVPDGKYLLRASGAGAALLEVDTRTLGDEPLVLHLGEEAMLRLDVQSNGESWELALHDGHGREVYRRRLRDGWKFPVPLPPGDYRAELRGPSGKAVTRQIHLGPGGADLRVP